MNSIEVCPQKIYEFWCDDSILTLAKSLLCDPTFKWNKITGAKNKDKDIHPDVDARQRSSVSDDRNLQRDERFQPIANWMEECLEEIRIEHNYKCDKFNITRLWGVKAHDKSDFHGHNHPFSMLSGVFYLTDSNAKTWIREPTIWEKVKFINNVPMTRDSRGTVSTISSEKGKLVIMPSFMSHSVDSHKDEEPRYTMAFNSFPSGVVGAGPEVCAGLNIQIL